MTYDCVIIGGGTAGCLVAGRLAAETQANILLLEAGPPDRNPLIHIPAGYPALLGDHRCVFPYQTTPQTQCDGRTIPLTQARLLGGGSSINAMAYVRGQPRDYADWDAATSGQGGWAFDQLLPHFRAMEANDLFADTLHGADGPLKVSQPPRLNDLNRAVMRAFQQIGLPYNPDYNGASQRGVGPVQATIGNARRCSAAVAFLNPARARRNLQIITGATATGLLFEGDRVTGVTYHSSTGPARAMANRIVLTAGALNTPRLLMLCGIGSQATLAAHGIAVRVPAADVGRHLQDHPTIAITAPASAGSGLARSASGLHRILAGLQYLLTKAGPAAGNGIESVSYYDPTDLAAEPTIQCYHAPLIVTPKPAGGAALTTGLTLRVVLLRPRSRGRVTLRSADPAAMPLIDPNYFADPRDLQDLVAGLRLARTALQTQALHGLLEQESTPGPDCLSDAQLAAFARATVTTMWHPAGTCRMGADADAVVDPALRMRGIRNLYIMDASIMPSLPSANTNSPTMMIASKGVDSLKADLQA